MAAEVAGVLEQDDGCLLLDGEPVIWPDGTEWDSDTQTLEWPDGVDAQLGARLYGGDGYLRVRHIEEMFGEEVAEAAGSRTGATDEVAVFNPGSQVTPIH